VGDPNDTGWVDVTHRIVIKDGVVRFVYDDALHAALQGLGTSTIARASHVEPATGYCTECQRPVYRAVTPERGKCQCPLVRSVWMGGWVADLSPVEGPLLLDCDEPFETREAALAAERRWIEEHVL
jgi:hypothetical protein